VTEEDLQTARRFAKALPEEPFGGPILRVIAELERLQGVEQRARTVLNIRPRPDQAYVHNLARQILGEVS